MEEKKTMGEGNLEVIVLFFGQVVLKETVA
jgi:hypothetical protein